MSLKPTQQKALLSTMRLTLFGAFGALAACGSGGSKAQTTPPAATAAGKTPATATADTTPATTPAKSAPSSEAECRGALTAAYPKGDPTWYDQAHPTARAATNVADAALAACCEQHAATLSDVDYRHLGCCAAAKWDAAHCTPWGPPMPPAMA